jgi:MoxR-like ATPase
MPTASDPQETWSGRRTLDDAAATLARVRSEVEHVIVGQRRVLDEVLICLLAGGHCLLRGVPGLAKTLLIKTLAQAIDLQFSRIQFTPDLMPSDIVGTDVIEEDVSTGKRHIRFIRGPIFANIILADEINRTPPKTQAALLEAMQERQVSVEGRPEPRPTALANARASSVLATPGTPSSNT